MFRPSDIIIDAFIEHLHDCYGKQFGKGVQSHRETITQVARMALARQASSNALYHSLEHTILCTQVGIDIMRGKEVKDGDVSSLDWLHYVASLLLFAIGFVRDCCQQDCGDHCIINFAGDVIDLKRGANDGALWPYFFERSQIFIDEHFSDHAILDAERLKANIAYTEFPPPLHGKQDRHTYPGLTRAAQIIGVVGDPKFINKLKLLYLELSEAGMAKAMNYHDVNDVRESYPRAFWRLFHPRILHAIGYLKYTAEGLNWLANMHAHMLMEEHRQPPCSVVTRIDSKRRSN